MENLELTLNPSYDYSFMEERLRVLCFRLKLTDEQTTQLINKATSILVDELEERLEQFKQLYFPNEGAYNG